MLLWFYMHVFDNYFLYALYLGCKFSILAKHLHLSAQRSFSSLSSFWLVFRKEVPRCNAYHTKAITCLAKLPKQSLVSHVIPSNMLSIVRRGCAPGVEVRTAAYVESSMQRYRLDKASGFSLVPHATLSPFCSACSCLNVTHPHTHTHTNHSALWLQMFIMRTQEKILYKYVA